MPTSQGEGEPQPHIEDDLVDIPGVYDDSQLLPTPSPFTYTAQASPETRAAWAARNDVLVVDDKGKVCFYRPGIGLIYE